MDGRLAGLRAAAGPGILFACTAIGVSHLIQSTRAGADYGMLMIGFVVLAAVLKYPFFEYGARYASSTGTSLIDGYRRLGRPALWAYLAITVLSMFFVTGAVGFVTAGFFENLFGLDLPDGAAVLALFAACAAILAAGRYSVLDGLVKVVGVVLLVSTVSAFALALHGGPAEEAPGFVPQELWGLAGLFFLLALMGWMPAPLDLSSWSSLWTLERSRQTGRRPGLGATLLEFRLSYAITGALAAMFVVLGALVFYGTGRELPDGGAGFAHEVVSMYTATIGGWSHLLIAASAFSVMFGTIIALLDGYSRSLRRTAELLAGRGAPDRGLPWMYRASLGALVAGSLAVVLQFGGSLRDLVDFATVLSFVVAPVIAAFNLRLVTGRHVDPAHRPSGPLRALSAAGIAFLAGFAAVFAAAKLGLVML